MQKDSRRGLTTHIAGLKIHDHREFLICYELTVIINLGHCVPGLVVQINRKKKLHWTGFEPRGSRLLSASPLR